MSINYAEKTANYPRLAVDHFFIDDENDIKFQGIVDRSVDFIQKVQLLKTDLWIRFVQQFKSNADNDGSWRCEYWGKLMRGACFVYSYTKNPQLYKELTETIEDMLTAQDENGRISTYGIEKEFDAWDLWGRKYVLLGMQYFLEICQDQELSEKIVDSMCRQVDYIIEKIGDPKEGKKPITSATRHWRGLNSSSLLEPIVRLYSITKEERYFEFASYIVSCGGTDVENIFELAYEDKLYPYQYPVTKAYEMTSCFEGLLEYYRLTGKERYKTSIINFANKVLESDFTIIGCCGCTHELFDHSKVRQANTNGEDNRMQETCVTVTLMKFFFQLTLLTGDSRYVDAFETALYNAYLGSINTEMIVGEKAKQLFPDAEYEPLPFDSYSPLTAGTRGNGIGGAKLMADRHYYGCCACIGATGLGMVHKIALLSTKRGFAMNLFIEGLIQTRTAEGNRVAFQINTDYPVNGRILVKTDMDQNEKFELLLRIPEWSRKTKLFVNGEAQKTTQGYASIDREWEKGDVIELELDMRTEALYPTPYGHQILMNKVIWGSNYIVPTFDKEDPKTKNHIALRRGPIILAQENRLGYCVDEPVEIETNHEGYVDAVLTKDPIAPYECILEVEVPLKDGTFMHVTDYASAGKLWTEESKMAAWILTVS